MILKTETFYVAHDEIVSNEDVQEALNYAKENNVLVLLQWSGPGWHWYPSERYGYTLYVNPDSDYEKLIAQLPKSYGV